MKEKLKKIFKTALEIKEDSVDVNNLNYGDNGWDSLVHMIIISEIENEFSIMLEAEDILEMSSVDKTESIILKYL